MRKPIGLALVIFLFASGVTHAQRYTASDGRLRVGSGPATLFSYRTLNRPQHNG